MFWNKYKIDKKMIQNLNPTSKASLKQMCLMSANGDLEKAQKLYDYMIKDMEDLPLFDAVPPSKIEQLKNGLGGTFSWINENQEQIFNWVQIFKNIFGKGGGGMGGAPTTPAAPVPPIN